MVTDSAEDVRTCMVHPSTEEVVVVRVADLARLLDLTRVINAAVREFDALVVKEQPE